MYLTTVTANDSLLGTASTSASAAVAAAKNVAGQSKWASILNAVNQVVPVAVSTYQASRAPQSIPQQAPAPQPVPQAPVERDDEARRGINTNIGFDLDRGLNLGGTTIPTLYLALGGLCLFLLYREPPRRGR